MQEFAHEQPSPPQIVAADGNWLIASDGKRYLDANCGYWCLALGCRPTAVENAVREQLSRFSHSTLLGMSHQPAEALADRLTSLAGDPFKHVFFCDSGSEAIEAALKMVYQYQVLTGHPERSEFLALGEAYHGDTLGAVALGGIDLFHAMFKPLLFNVRHVPPPHCYRCSWNKKPADCVLECAGAMEQAIAEHHTRLAAIVIEPFVLGPGGIIPHPPQYLERVLRAAKKHGVVVIFDEVAVGMGRLGTLFAFEQLEYNPSIDNSRCATGGLPTSAANGSERLRPDIVCLAKGLTGGILPLSAVMATDEIYSAFLGTYAQRRTFFHGHTFTGSALGCAAALAALDQLSAPGFLEHLQNETIPHLQRVLAPLLDHPHVGSLRGRGLMMGFELVKDRTSGEDYPASERRGHRVVLEARKLGVNTRAIGDLVLSVPPLTITSDELELLGRVMVASVNNA
jgi:adenosylmethionine-8-amino-7-oxononanoate aminotransferase